MEKSLDLLRADRILHLEMLRWAFFRTRAVLSSFGLGDVKVGPLTFVTEGNVALVLHELAACLVGLKQKIKDILMEEGRKLASAVAEYVLTCLHSHDPCLSLESIHLSIIEGT